MFQFRRFPSYAYLIQRRMTEYCSAGFPHSEISGSMLMCSSPKLIAACHVLLRLLMPRHSPCALSSLTFSSHSASAPLEVWFSRIMQASEFIGYIVLPFFKVPQFAFALCCLLRILSICIVQFSRCSFRPLSRPD